MKTEKLFKIVHTTLLTCIIYNMTACVAVVGTPKGMQAFSDMQNGLITNGKSTPDKATEYFATRNIQETEQTKRDNNPSFLSRLVSSSAQ